MEYGLNKQFLSPSQNYYLIYQTDMAYEQE